MSDPYETLGVLHDAPRILVQRQFYRLTLQLHPDKHPTDPGAPARFQEVRLTLFKIALYVLRLMSLLADKWRLL